MIQPEGATLEGRNRAFHRLIVEGVTVEYRDSLGAIRGAQARVIDFDDPANNDWLAVNYFTVVENQHERRPDVVLFVNGLPFSVVELKNPTNEKATIWSALQQLETYKVEIPSLFVFNPVLMVSDGVEARVGTLTAGWEWFKPWRTIPGEALVGPTFATIAGDTGGSLFSGSVPGADSKIYCIRRRRRRGTGQKNGRLLCGWRAREISHLPAGVFYFSRLYRILFGVAVLPTRRL